MSRAPVFGALVGGALMAVAIAAGVALRADTAAERRASGSATTTKAADKPSDASAEKAPSGETAVSHALDERAEFKLTNEPLSGLAAFVADRFKINVVFDGKALADSGSSSASRISFQARDISLRSALNIVLRQRELGYFESSDNVLTITTADEADRHLVLRVYDVQNLLPRPDDQLKVAEPQNNQLMDVLQMFYGEQGSSPQMVQTKLIVSENEQAQFQFAELLAALGKLGRQVSQNDSGQNTSAISIHGPEAEAARIEKTLDEQVDFEFANRTLLEIVDSVRARTGLEIQIDTEAITDAGNAADTKFSISLKHVHRRDGLRQLLRPHDLGFVVEGDYLLITSLDCELSADFPAIYPVGDLVATDDPDSADYDTLINAIASDVSPTSWGGGEVPPIAVISPCKALVIVQTEEIHRQIGVLLAKLRAAKTENPPPPADQQAMVVRFYSVPRASADAPPDSRGGQQTIDAIRKLIAPKSWSAPDAYIGLLPGAIVVRQTAEVHRQISNFFRSLSNATFGGGFRGQTDAPKSPHASRGNGPGDKPKD